MVYVTNPCISVLQNWWIAYQEDRNWILFGRVLKIFTMSWALGFMVADMQHMYQLTQPVTGGGARMRKFFSTFQLNYRMISHSLLIIGLALEDIGYEYYQDDREQKYKDEMKCMQYDTYTYGGNHPVKIGLCFQGVAQIMIICYLLQFFRLHSTVGTVYQAMRRIIPTLFSFAFIFCSITLAFALGMHYILKVSGEQCKVDGDTEPYSCNVTYTKQGYRNIAFTTQVSAAALPVSPKANNNVHVNQNFCQINVENSFVPSCHLAQIFEKWLKNVFRFTETLYLPQRLAFTVKT